jgi:PAS domain S-box-containing protein
MKNIDIRKLAEEQVTHLPNNILKTSTDEIKQMFHELQVHQIELEMQNDELNRLHNELGISNARYFDLYDMAPIGYLTVNNKNRIIESNFTAANLLGTTRKTILNNQFTNFIKKEDQEAFYLYLRKLANIKETEYCELRMEKKDKTTFWVQLTGMVVPDGDSTVYRIMIIDITKRKQAEEIIDNYNADLEIRLSENTATSENRLRKIYTLNQQLIFAEEKERHRISHVLHEEVQQTLVAARMILNVGIRQLSDNAPSDMFDKVDRMLNEAILEVRVLTHQIVPTELYEKSIQDAVISLARQMHERFNFSVEVITDDRIINVNHCVSICAYHAVREMLLNVDKHAKVRTAEVKFSTHSNKHFQLSVSDRGTGFAVNNSPEYEGFNMGFGLLTIKKQVEGLGGSLAITSLPDVGTTINLLLPFKMKKSKETMELTVD